MLSKCSYLSSILASEGEPIYKFEHFGSLSILRVMGLVSHEQVLTTSTSLVPNVFLPNPLKTERKQDKKAVVFISSPFALVKESLVSFLHNISFHKIELYFTSDNELIIQNNMNGNDSFTNADQLLSPLPYITECLKPSIQDDISLSSFSICINALPLCSRIRSAQLRISSLYQHEFRSSPGSSPSPSFYFHP